MLEELNSSTKEANTLYYSISKSVVDKYEFIKTKENVEQLINEYKTAKFEYLASNNALEKLSILYQPKYEQHINNANDKLGRNVAKKLDSKNTIESFDAILNPLTKLFSNEEKKYYDLCLINNNSEQFTSDLLGISRTGLQTIKRSCILKIALAFHVAVMK